MSLDSSLLPTEEDVAFYHEHGWYISPKIIPDEVLEAARRGADRLYRGERDFRLPIDSGFSDWRPEHEATIRNNEFVSLQIREIADLIHAPAIGATAARLARTPSIRLLDDQLIYKPPGSPTAVGWHADRAYWATCSSDNLLTAWIPFHDVDVERGPLVVLDGSHLWPGMHDTRFFNNVDLEQFEDVLMHQGRQVKRVPITLRQGQVSFHHCWTLHASYPNCSEQSRLALALHLQDHDNAYRPYEDAQGKAIHMIDEALCGKLPNGDPDFADPAVFPTLWRQAIGS